MPDYTYIDKPFFLQFLFYPRSDFKRRPDYAFDFFVEVKGGKRISCRFYKGGDKWPWILYFHGNGEVVSDYDDLAPLYHARNINIAVADYRGYGASTGEPTFTDLVDDAHIIYRAARQVLAERGLSSTFYIMGRSLGSLSALELAYHYQSELDGLIIESGFASVTRLIVHLGIMESNIQLDEIEKQCLQMINGIKCPVLIIHGEWDNLVMPVEGKTIFENLGSQQKEMVIIPQADHNDVIIRDVSRYFGSINKFVNSRLSEL